VAYLAPRREQHDQGEQKFALFSYVSTVGRKSNRELVHDHDD
jgi:hypothetical protein